MAKIELEDQLGEEQIKIIEKYDKEQKTRNFDKASLVKIVYWIAIIISLYHFTVSFIGAPATLKHRSLHVSMMLFMTFILYPATNKSSRKKLPVYDLILALLSLTTTIYVWIDYPNIIARAGLINTADMIVGTILVLL